MIACNVVLSNLKDNISHCKLPGFFFLEREVPVVTELCLEKADVQWLFMGT